MNICGCKLIELPFLRENLSGSSLLVVGERIGDEGIISTCLEKTNNIICTDLDGTQPNSLVEQLVKENKIKYIQADFTEFDESQKFGQIACINVLEHFGMCWGGHSSLMDWNYDLKGIEKMINLLEVDGKAIITVPAGPPIFYGDCLMPHGLPFLRRYDPTRMSIIRSFVKERNIAVREKLFYSPNMRDWQEVSESVLNTQMASQHFDTPNFIWGFTLTKIK